MIKDEWIDHVTKYPEYQSTQSDGRVRKWGRIKEMDGRYLRVILLEDQETIHNAFFDRRFRGYED